MKIHSLLPHLENQRILRLWHQAQEAQWSALAIDWKAAVRIGEADRDRMARILTPVLMSEQSAMNSAGALFPLVGSREEHESQYYLASWIVDEARHAELFFRMIHRFDREPMSQRRFPEAYYFQSRVYSQDIVLFLAGLLVSEVLAKHSMSEFLRLDIDPALSQICERILDDEARHLGFNHLYLEEHLAGLERVSADESAACAVRLTERLDAVLAGLPKFLRALDAETRAIGFQTEAILAGVDEEARTRLRRSIEAGRRKGVPAVPAARP
jgi:hypothetical protein